MVQPASFSFAVESGTTYFTYFYDGTNFDGDPTIDIFGLFDTIWPLLNGGSEPGNFDDVEGQIIDTGWSYNGTTGNSTALVLDDTREEFGEYVFVIGGDALPASIDTPAEWDAFNGGLTSIDYTAASPFAAGDNIAFAGLKDVSTTEDDVFAGTSGGDDIEAGIGNDEVYGLDGNDTIDGGDGDDTIETGSGDDSVRGGAGNDRITNGALEDTIDAGAGDDTIYGNDWGDTIETGPGNDLVYAAWGNDRITNSGGADTIYGEERNDVIIGNADLSGGPGALFDGGPGHDVLRANIELGTQLYGGTGRDTLEGFSGDDTVYGGDGPDVARLRNGDDLYTDTGQQGLLGADHVEGGGGDDTILGGGGNDTLYGDEGDDELRGGEDDDWLYGGDGQDRMFGEGGDDTIVSNGNSTYYGRSELIRGGDGNDLVQIIGSSGTSDHPTIIYLDNGNDTLEQQPYIRGVLRVFAGNGDDTMSVYYNQTVFGGKGNDLIEAQGNLTADGGDGFDTIISHIGRDDITGGNGRDFVRMGTDDDIFRDSNQGGVNGADTVLGEDGHDTIMGGGGNDLFKGQKHNDLISGGDGHDTLDGGPGKDTIAGGNGNDALTGGTERDQFIFRPGTGHDRITDYETGIDILRFGREFWEPDGPPDTAQFITDHATVVGTDVVITLDDISVTLLGVSTIDGLADDLVYF